MTTKPPNIKTEKDNRRILVIDTNVIEATLNNNSAKSVIDKLVEFIKSNNCYSKISELTVFELNKTVKFDKGEVVAKYLKNWKRYEVSQPVLSLAAQLLTFYSRNPATKGHTVDDADAIIAATAIIATGWVVTINCNDFPRPFFKEVESLRVDYMVKGHLNTLVICVLAPQYGIIIRALEEWQEDGLREIRNREKSVKKAQAKKVKPKSK